VQLGDLMAANVNRIQQKNFVRGMYETFTAAAADLGLATALVGSFFSPTRRLVYCNAGTPPPLTRAAGTPQWVSLKGQTASGVAADHATPGVVARDEYQYGTLTLQTDDLVLMYNESLLEVRLADGRVLGVEGFRDLVQKTDAERPEQVVPAIVKRLENASQQDWNTMDVTMILCRCTATRTTWKANLLAPLRLLGSANKQLEFVTPTSTVPSNR
jgi:serine phosphatase RsbU (regulator of sigma subunit)